MTRIDGLVFQSSPGVNWGAVDQADGFGYFGIGYDAATIVKYDLDTFERVATLTLPPGEGTAVSGIIDEAADALYIGTTFPAYIIKIDLATFTRVGSIALDPSEDPPLTPVIDPAGGYVYFGTHTSPGQIVRIDLDTFTDAGTLILDSGEEYLISAVIDPAAGFAYFGTNTSPGMVVKVNLTTFVRDSAITLDPGEESMTSAVIDPAAGFAYFGTNTDPGIVVKVDLSPFSRVGAVALQPQESYLAEAAIDPANGKAYFGVASSSPAAIVQIDLAGFTRTGALQLNPGEDSASAMIIDTTDGALFIGTQTTPGLIVNVALNQPLTTEFRLEYGELITTCAAVSGWEQVGPGEAWDMADSAHLTDGDPTANVPLLLTDGNAAFVPGEQKDAGSETSSITLGATDFTELEFAVTPTGSAQAATYCFRLTDEGSESGVTYTEYAEASVAVEAVSQTGYRWRNDDGSEGGATPATAEDAPLTGLAVNDEMRLRLAAAAAGSATGLDRVDAITLDEEYIEQDTRSALIDAANGFAYVGTSRHIVKVDLSTFTRVDAIQLEPDEGDPHAGVIDTINGFAYFNLQGPGQLIKIDLAPFSRVPGVLNLSVNNPHAGFIDDTSTYAYWSADDVPGRLAKVELSTFTEVDVLTFTDAGAGMSAVYDGINEVAYLGTYEQNQKEIVKIDLGTFTQTDLIDISCPDCGFSDQGGPTAVIDVANQLAYFGLYTDNQGTYDSAARIYRIDLAPFAVVDSLDLDLVAQERFVASAVIDTAAGFAYFAGFGDSPGHIIKIDLSGFTREATIVLPLDEYGLHSAVIDPTAGFAYFGTATQPTQLVKINLASFTRVDDLEFVNDVGDNGPQVMLIDSADRSAYLGTQTDPARVVKIDLDTFAKAGHIDMLPGEGSITSGVIDTAAGFAYFATQSSPGNIIKIDLDTFTRVGVIALQAGEDELHSAAIDPVGGFAYFGTNTLPGIVVKIDLDTFTRVDALTLDPGDDRLRSAAIDPAGGFAYFGTDGFPRRLVKVSLSPFVRADAIEDSGDDETYRSMAIDPEDGYLMVGTLNSPGRVIKFTLNPFARADHADLEDGENNLTSMALDPARDVAYIGGEGNFPGVVVAVDVASVRRLAGIELDSGENQPLAAVYDPADGSAYFATNTSPGRVVKVSTSTPREFRLEVADKAASCAASIGWASLPNADWQLFDTAAYVDGAASSNVPGVLTDPASTFVTGELKDAGAQTSPIGLFGDTFTELEYAIRYTGPAAGAYCFRLTDAGDPNVFTYASYAEATTPPPPGGGGGGGTTPPSVTVVQPNGGESINGNSSYNIVWSSGGSGISTYRASYSTDAGGSWTVVASGLTSNSIAWTVPNVSTSSARVRVEALDASNAVIATDDSNANFTIVAQSTPPPGDTPPSNPPPVVNPPNQPPPEQHDYIPAVESAKEPTIDALIDAPPAANPPCVHGDLFRGTLSTVYYCGADGRRYPFPNEKTYFTWYENFSGVRRVSNDFIRSIPIGPYVTYKPGVRMVKIQIDPKAYAVAPGAVIRWITTEQVARDLYGVNWNSKIDDIPLVFWSGYTPGEPIY